MTMKYNKLIKDNVNLEPGFDVGFEHFTTCHVPSY